MAFDISLDASPQPVEPAPADFEEFYTAKVDVVVAALTLSCTDSEVTDAAVTTALTKSSQRWNHLVNHPNPAGWVVQAGLAQAEKALRDHAPAGINRATGGYERGLSLDLAFATLPLLQRAALVTGYYLEWSDAFTAAGFETPLSTVRTRRERAISFIGHHLQTGRGRGHPAGAVASTRVERARPTRSTSDGGGASARPSPHGR